MRRCCAAELEEQERRRWLQTGLALSPLCGTCAQYSLDVILGPLQFCFQYLNVNGPGMGAPRIYFLRTPKLIAWARAYFEQGALPSILYLPGIAPVFSLPGDKSFPCQGTGCFNLPIFILIVNALQLCMRMEEPKWNQSGYEESVARYCTKWDGSRLLPQWWVLRIS